MYYNPNTGKILKTFFSLKEEYPDLAIPWNFQEGDLASLIEQHNNEVATTGKGTTITTTVSELVIHPYESTIFDNVTSESILLDEDTGIYTQHFAVSKKPRDEAATIMMRKIKRDLTKKLEKSTIKIDLFYFELSAEKIELVKSGQVNDIDYITDVEGRKVMFRDEDDNVDKIRYDDYLATMSLAYNNLMRLPYELITQLPNDVNGFDSFLSDFKNTVQDIPILNSVNDNGYPKLTLNPVGIINTPNPIFSGTVKNCINPLILTIGDKSYSVNVSGDGNWGFTIPDDGSLKPGAGMIEIKTDEEFRNKTIQDDYNVQIPELYINDLKITSDLTPDLGGRYKFLSETFTLRLPINSEPEDDIVVDFTPDDSGEGNWTYEVPSDKLSSDGGENNDGTYRVTMTTNEAENNVIVWDDFKIDTSTVIIEVAGLGVTNDASPTMHGTVQNASKALIVKIFDSDDTLLHTYDNIDITDDVWSLDMPEDDELSDGEYKATIYSNEDDDEKNSSTDDLFEINTKPYIAMDRLSRTDDNTPTFSGVSLNCIEDFKLTIKLGNDEVEYNVPTGEEWEFTIPDGDELGDETYTIKIETKESSNNVTEEQETIIDKYVPTISIDDIVKQGTHLPKFEGGSSYTQVDIIIQVLKSDDSMIREYTDVTPDDNGNWTLTIPEGDELIDNDYTLVAIAKDKQGNRVEATKAFVVDAEDPVVSINTYDATDDDTPSFSGTSSHTRGTTLTLSIVVDDDDQTAVADYTGIVTDSEGDWDQTIDRLDDGDYKAIIKGEDGQGNDADEKVEPFTIDVQTASVTIKNYGTLTDSTPLIEGTWEHCDGDLTLKLNGKSYVLSDGAGKNDDGTWALTVPDDDALDDGDYTAEISESDDVKESDTFEINAKDPSVTVEEVGDENNEIANDTPTFKGTHADCNDDQFKIIIKNITDDTQFDRSFDKGADGAWEYTITSDDALPVDKDYRITIQVTDGHADTDAEVSTEFKVLPPVKFKLDDDGNKILEVAIQDDVETGKGETVNSRDDDTITIKYYLDDDGSKGELKLTKTGLATDDDTFEKANDAADLDDDTNFIAEFIMLDADDNVLDTGEVAFKSGVAAGGGMSDIRIKTNIKILPNALEAIKSFRGIEFDWIESENNNHHEIGVIAQDIEKFYPEIIGKRKDGMKNVKYHLLVSPLIEAVKELSTQNDMLLKRLEVLEKGFKYE